MRLLKKILLWLAGIVLFLYVSVCVAFYFGQEHILFIPTKLPANYVFTFPGKFSEQKIKAADGAVLNGVLFKADSSKGLVFYLHGNAGALDGWGEIADTYTSLGYDLFMLDYRGYGKSEGKITSEKELYSDVQAAYNAMLKMYPENKIIVLGYSIGTGPAAMLAANNHPRRLILQAPYYSITDVMHHDHPMFPGFILRYPLRTGEFVHKTKVPVVIFHGDEDEVIYYGSSLKIKEGFKAGDTLVTLHGQGHSGITNNDEYRAYLRKVLE